MDWGEINLKNEVILEAVGLKKYFPIETGFLKKSIEYVHAIDTVNIKVNKGEALGIVGESGCGKSTLAQVLVNIYSPTEGKIFFEGVDVSPKAARNSLGFKKNIQMVFQDPFWSLNPRKMVRDIIMEPLKVHRIVEYEHFDTEIERLMDMVGIGKKRMFSYPHEFSGGERQRIAIARALAARPKLVILDEPTSSIDTLSQAEILNLLIELRDEFNLSYILISHDLSVVHFLSDRLAVMYLGKIVEIGKTETVFNLMYHPYTQALMKAIPLISSNGTVQNIEALEGNVPSAINPPKGCRFHTRCYKCQEICRNKEPELREFEDGHFAACHFANQS